MNNSLKALLLAAAGTGLMSGTVPTQPNPSPLNSNGATSLRLGQTAFNAATQDTAKHACKGQNSCKGQGGCNAGDMGCKGKNSCKGKGGCNTM